MSYRFIAGVLFAILAGISTYLGQVFQKTAVNDIPEHFTHKKYSYLLKRKTWILGLSLYIISATVFYMLSELLIGPLLIPGIMTSGLIVLVIASVKIAKEKITLKTIIGMIILSAGTVTITFSKLTIDYTQLSLNNGALIARIIYFSILTILLWLLFNYLVKKSTLKKGMYKAVAAGFPYVLSNFWILPLYASAHYILNKQSNVTVLILFAVSCIILIVTNILGITELQIAYEIQDVNITAPLQQIPIQIAPAAYYYVLYNSLKGKSVFTLITGILIIIASSFLLVSRTKGTGEGFHRYQQF